MQSERKATIELAIKAAQAYGRGDLADRLEKLQIRLSQPDMTVVVLGQFKQGKSSLVNALVGGAPCSVDDDIATAVPTIVRYGKQNKAWALLSDGDSSQQKREPIEWQHVPGYVTAHRRHDSELEIKGVEVELPRKLLAKGIVVVDTPGVGGLGSAHATACLGTLSMADAGLFISDVSQEFTQAEIDYLKQAQELCSTIVCVATKIDLYPAWREVIKRNTAHLQSVGIETPILAVSSQLRSEAIRRKDKAMNEESGCGQLVRMLTDDFLQTNDRQLSVKTAEEVSSVCEQLRSQLEAELIAVESPEKSSQLLGDLEAAKERSERLRSSVSRWNITLNDGIGDLNSDVDYDFRQRMRQVTKEADEAIESGDPLELWDEFEPWLVNRVSYDVVANYRFLAMRSNELSALVGDHFMTDGGDMLHQIDIYTADTALGRVKTSLELDVKETSKAAKGMTVLKGSYSGMLMCTMLGSMISVPPLAPIAAGIGLMMGRKSLKDEKERALKQRRGEAKNSMRRYGDEVSFQVNKDSRDTLRKVQRQLRDHYSARAEELNRSTSEALRGAAEAVKKSESEKAARGKDLRAEINRVNGLAARAGKLVSAATQ